MNPSRFAQEHKSMTSPTIIKVSNRQKGRPSDNGMSCVAEPKIGYSGSIRRLRRFEYTLRLRQLPRPVPPVSSQDVCANQQRFCQIAFDEDRIWACASAFPNPSEILLSATRGNASCLLKPLPVLSPDCRELAFRIKNQKTGRSFCLRAKAIKNLERIHESKHQWHPQFLREHQWRYSFCRAPLRQYISGSNPPFLQGPLASISLPGVSAELLRPKSYDVSVFFEPQMPRVTTETKNHKPPIGGVCC